MRKIDKLLQNPDVYALVDPRTGEPGNLRVQFEVRVAYTHEIRRGLDTPEISPYDRLEASIAEARRGMVRAVEDLLKEAPEIPPYDAKKP